MKKEYIDRLTTIVSPENISTDPLELEVYSRDPTIVRGMAEAVVWPTNAEQISKIMIFVEGLFPQNQVLYYHSRE